MLNSVREFFGSGNSAGIESNDDRTKENHTDKQLKELRDRLMPVFRSDATQSHGERSLRRFLRAAGSDVETAYADILRYNHWRKTHGVDRLSPTDPDILEHLALGFVHSLRLKDAMGRPVLYVIARKHSASNRDLEKLVKFTVYMLETTIKRMDESVSESLCLVFDLHQFALANMDYPFVKRLVWLLTRFYPERLGVCLIYNAPAVFQGCWPIIRHWLHEETASKVVFVPTKQAMSEYLDLDGLPPQDM